MTIDQKRQTELSSRVNHKHNPSKEWKSPYTPYGENSHNMINGGKSLL